MALTGFQAGQTCFGTQIEAIDSHFNSISTIILANGNTVYFQKNNLTGVWQRVELTPLNIFTLTTVPNPSFQPCDPMIGFNDGIALSMLIVGALVVAVSGGIISRAKK